jgi:hypothetical protein
MKTSIKEQKMSDIKKLIKTALEDEGSSFKEGLNSAISSRISDRLELRKEEIASEVLDDVVETPINESTFTFKSTGEANKFLKAAGGAGLSKKSYKLKGKNVSISKLKDTDLEQMLELIAKDMKAKIS